MIVLGLTNNITVSVASITPPFIYFNQSNAVTINTAPTIPPNMTGFEFLPRVYISPDPSLNSKNYLNYFNHFINLYRFFGNSFRSCSI